jgi:orotidine-5'-phosphate decarboxylase
MKSQLIVALDVEKIEEAERLVKLLSPTVSLFKMGSQLWTAYGPESLKAVREVQGRVFLDLKFHDIPNTVGSAVRSAVGLNVFMMTLHTCGGAEMMKAAAAAAQDRAALLKIERPKIVGVTVLTSDPSGGDTQKIVVERALLAQQSGLDGAVCSVQEAAAVRKACGKDFLIVTPGIRLPEGARGDQKRVATPDGAVAAGSNFLVVGRPIVEAPDSLGAAEQVIKAMEEGRGKTEDGRGKREDG